MCLYNINTFLLEYSGNEEVHNLMFCTLYFKILHEMHQNNEWISSGYKKTVGNI